MVEMRGGDSYRPSFREKGNHMVQMITAIGRLALRDDGQDLMEYGLLAALIAIVAIAGITVLGNTIFLTFWQNIGQAL
jgi:Flp pilus assembly pilin Flp